MVPVGQDWLLFGYFQFLKSKTKLLQIQRWPYLTITDQVTLNEEMVVGSRLSMNVTLEGLIPIHMPCIDFLEGTYLGSWCQQDSSETLPS